MGYEPTKEVPTAILTDVRVGDYSQSAPPLTLTPNAPHPENYVFW